MADLAELLRRIQGGGPQGPVPVADDQPVAPAAQQPSAQLPQDNQTIHDRLLARFGQDFSPAARAAVEQRAAERKRSPFLVGGALLEGLGNVVGGEKPGLTDTLEKRRVAIDAEEMGKFDANRERAMKDLLASNGLTDRERVMKMQDTKFGQEQSEYGDEHAPDSMLSQIARETVKKVGLPVTDDTSYDTISKVYPFLKDQLVAAARARTAGLGGFAPADAPLLAATLQGIQQGTDPASWTLPVQGASPKALGTAITGTGAARGRYQTQGRFETIRGKPAQALQDTAGMLTALDRVGEGLPGWNSNWLRNEADAAAGWVGLDSPKQAALRSRMAQAINKYRLTVTGQAAGDAELARLEQQLPNPGDRPEVAAAKLAEFQNYFRDQYDLGLTFARGQRMKVDDFEKLGAENGWTDGHLPSPGDAVQPGSPAAGGAPRGTPLVEAIPPIERRQGGAGEKTVVRRQRSPSRPGKVKLIYSDGTSEVVDG